MTDLKEIKLTFLGEPTPKAAIKHVFAGGKMHGFKPAKTQHAMDDIRAQLKPQLPVDWTAIEGPISATVVFRRIKPASVPRRLYPHTRPDLDNYLKLLWDALNGVIFKDDAQIISVTATKIFGEAGIDVLITELPTLTAKPPKIKKTVS